MKYSTAALGAAFALAAIVATPVLAIEAENNKQAPAPQGTVAPESNAKTGATTGSSTGGGDSATTDLNTVPSESSTGASDGSTGASGTSSTSSGPKTREGSNTQVPAPANTQPPTKK